MYVEENLKRYFKEIEEKTKIAYSIAEEARRKSLDPVNKVEISPAKGLVERVVGIVSVKHPQVNVKEIRDRIRELEKEYGFLDLGVALKISEETAKQKFCKFNSRIEALEAGIRLAIAYLTLGIVSSPIEGFVKLEERKRRDGKKYLCAFFAGPIRSAGATSAALSLVIIDYLRKIFGYEKYDPTEQEIKRAITEIYDYNDFVTNLQYLPDEKEIEIIANSIPIQVDGEASENRDVSNYKDLYRVSTNKIRSGFCLVLAEGLAQKSAKVLKKIKNVEKKGILLYEDWKFLEKLKKSKKNEKEEKKIEPSYEYIRDIVAGRPILGHPLRPGGLRLRYGRTRHSGYSAAAIHPALSYVIGDFIAIGTQLRTERPGKSCSLATTDFIDGPIVKLDDQSVVKISDIETAFKYKDKISEIIYLGDILISYGDFFNRNHVLVPSGYVEEWWFSELKEKLFQIINTSNNLKEVNEAQKLYDSLKDHNYFNISLIDAIKICKKYNLPLYPKYIFFWSQVDTDSLRELIEWIRQGRFNMNKDFILLYSKSIRKNLTKAKRALELLGVEHYVFADNIVIKKKEALALFLNLGFLKTNDVLSFGLKELEELNKKIKEANFEFKQDVLISINFNSEFEIRDKAGTFIGARMGRPEKAKPRALTGQPNTLFPVGEEGGRLRSFNESMVRGYVKADFPTYYCENCNNETVYFLCENCGKETTRKYWCSGCSKLYNKDFCKIHGKLRPYRTKKLDINYYFEKAIEKLNLSKDQLPSLIKGVRGTNSEEHIPENLAKGILRAIHGLPVNKDGTIRYDATELPLTHFKPKEASVSIEKLKELGYTHDIYGNPLESEDQLLALFPQDIILPASKESIDERADKFFFRVAKFIDDLLVRFYGMQSFYNIEKREDLIGHLMLCIAPHNAAGTVVRIIGFSNTQTLLASPFLHGALRRDCDGDEAGFMLLLDALLNFSLKFLPAHRGGTQDSPLICNIKINQNEVDDMVFDMESTILYPKELYELAQKYSSPYSIKIPQVVDNLSNYNAFLINFTHPCSDINLGNKCSAYKKLATMQEKVEKQMEVGEKIRAVDENHLASLIITRHFIRDIKGNLRKFSIQRFRCVQCNQKYRRPPLRGKCLNCNGRIIFTIAEGTIKKYLQPALDLANKYNVPNYVKQSLDLIKSSIEAIFGKEETKQVSLEQWF